MAAAPYIQKNQKKNFTPFTSPLTQLTRVDRGEGNNRDEENKGGEGGETPQMQTGGEGGETTQIQTGGEGGETPQMQTGGEGGETPLDTTWTDNLKHVESMYNDFYKEPIYSIKIFILYINKENELTHLRTDKSLLSEDGCMKRDTILSFIKQYQTFASIHYKLLSLLKYNIDLEPTDIYNFVKEGIHTNNKRFLNSEKYLNDIHFDESIHMFQDLNALIFIFYEDTHKSAVHTKRVKITDSHCKTKRNNHMIKKNLKINKQIS